MFLLPLALALLPTADDPDVPSTPAARCPEVVRRGEGTLQLLIVPAMSARWKVWEGFLERNAERYDMVAVTLPGFGGSPAPDLPRGTVGTPWSDHSLDALEAVIDELELRDVCVVGHSFGAGLAVQLAARRPEVVASIVNVDGMITCDPGRDGDSPAERAADGDANVLDVWKERFDDPEEWARFNGWSENPALTRRELLVHGSNMATPKHVVLECWREMWIWDLNPIVRKLEVPVLDLRALKPNDPEPEATRTAYLERLEVVGVPPTHVPLFLFDTNHAVEGQRPEVFDELVWAFLHGDELQDRRFD